MIGSILKIGLFGCTLFAGIGVDVSYALDAVPFNGKCVSLAPHRRDLLIASISEVSIGDSKKDVFMATGAPDLLVEQYTKNARTAVGQSAYFFLKKCNVNNKLGTEDNYVELLFDVSDRLVGITPVKVDGVEGRSKWTMRGK